jgi:polysaccharide biosynthesis protein PslG
MVMVCAMALTGVLLSHQDPNATATNAISRFSPSADAYVSQARPNGNFGTFSALQTDTSPTERSYVRFNVTQLVGPVTRATLRLYGHRRNRFGYTVWSVPNGNWTEDQITYASAPTPGSVVARSGLVSRNSWTSVDVTAAVHGDGMVSFALTTTGAVTGEYASRESGETGPQLVVETLATIGAVASTTARATTATARATTTARATITGIATTLRLSPDVNSAGPAVTGSDRFGIAAGCCIQWLSPTELAQQLDDYQALGVRWLRFDMAWSGVQAGGPESYNWMPYDGLVRAANSRGIKLLGMIGYTPAWARPADCRSDDKCAPANVNDFAFFAGQAARRYGRLGLHAWEIWNEENSGIFWKPVPNPSLYARMLKASYSAIKQNDPDSWAVTGGMAPATTGGGAYSPVDFLKTIYRNGAKGAFDAVGAHPYCWAGSFDCPSRDATWSAWSQMSSTQESLRSVMMDNGDHGKRIWGTEFGAPTAGSRQAVSEDRQANQVVDSYRLFSSHSWTGPLFWYSYRDACSDAGDTECHFGLIRHDGSRKPAYIAYQQLT